MSAGSATASVPLLKILQSDGGWEEFCKRLAQPAHPVYRQIGREELITRLDNGESEESVLNLIERRNRIISLERRDPVRYGWQPQMWLDADEWWSRGRELLVLGGNRSAKSTYAARRVVELLIGKPGCQIWCFSTSFETSVRDQQRLIYQYLPSVWRGNRSGRGPSRVYMSYTLKRGFTEKSFICPNLSECRFMNYMQDAEVIEGGQVDLWWADELIPADWIVTLRSRTVDRRGRGVITQTPIKGYTQTVAEYLGGARVTEWRDCELLPTQVLWPTGKPGKVPYKMIGLNPNHRIIFFHPKNNPYVPYDELVSNWKEKGSVNILCRLYGVTSGVSNCKFPRFGAHNIVKPDAIPKKGTNYHYTDFSWSKPWAMLWVRCLSAGDRKTFYIYREWPDYDSCGEWVIRSEKPDGWPGPAQQSCGYGINDYKRLIRSLEKSPGQTDPQSGHETEPIFARYGDPRSGAATALVEEGATTIFQMLEEEDADCGSLLIEPVVGRDNQLHILEGVNLINTLLEYDADKPISPFNCPRLYVSESCQNTIDCLKMWTGADGAKGASKDFIDLIRYVAIMDPDDVRDDMLAQLSKGGSY